MKKLLVFAFLAGWASLGLAQIQDSSFVQPTTVIKFLPIDLTFQSVSFEFEQMINPKNSISFGFGFPKQESVIGKESFTDKYDINVDPDIQCAVFGTTHLRMALRHYTGKQQGPKGFYIEPYLKYQYISGGARILGFEKQTNNPYYGLLNFKLNTYSAGLQFGAQFMIAKTLTVDLYFLGLEAGLLNGKVTSASPNSTQATLIKGKIDRALNHLPSVWKDKIDVTQSGYRVNVKADNVPYPWIRGGISIGLAF